MKSRWYRWTAIAAVIVVLAVAVRTCTSGSNLADREPGKQIDAELTLQTVILEQPDENGNLLWRLKAKSVTYTPDKQRAELTGLDGEFFQVGKTIYTVTADRGEVRQNGETLFLRGNLVANSPENELTMKGERLKWQPQKDLLVMGDFEDRFADDSSTDVAGGAADPAPGSAPDSAPVTGFDPQIEAKAQVMQVSNKENKVELTGEVFAKSKAAPWLTFASEQLTWFTEQKVIEADQPLKVEQYQSKDYKTVSDRLSGDTGQVQLDENIVTLTQAVQLDLLSQPLKIDSEVAVWDVGAQTVQLDQPVNINQPERKITASASQASLDLAKKIIYLVGNVRANGEKNDARLAADQVTWQTATQNIEAEGNVRYQQAANPEISMTGSKATGNIEQGTVVVTGGESGEVVTEIVPGEF